jgi:hypothetical protein
MITIDETIHRGDTKDLTFVISGDVTARELFFTTKASTTPTGSRLIEKANTLGGGDATELEASYASPDTTITVHILPVDTDDLQQTLLYADIESVDAADATDVLTIANGTLTLDVDVRTPFDGSALPADAERYVPVLASDYTDGDVITVLDTDGVKSYVGTAGIDTAISLQHTQGTDQGVDLDGTYPTTAEQVYRAVQSLNISARVNEIQPAGGAGATVGYTLTHPSYMIGMDGYQNPYSPNFGNYYDVVSGSVMVYIPKHYIKITADNLYSYKSVYDYADETLAATAGYFLPRCFIDGGVIKNGYFRDKYPHNGIEGGVAVSKQGIIPLTPSDVVTGYGFANCTGNSQTPTNTYGGALAMAKSRGNDFYTATVFHDFDMMCLYKAHQQASVSTTYCAWNDVSPYAPKGNNNNALKDTDDASVVFTTAGNADYSQRALTGSGSPFAKTTHNGQACGIADLNGNMHRISIGLTSNGTNLYTLKESIAFKNLVDSISGATAAFDIANFDSIGANPSSFTQIGGTTGWERLGNGTNQVFSGETDRTVDAYKIANAGLPLPTGHSVGGTADFGFDGIYVPAAFPSVLCPIAGLYWNKTFSAGVAGRNLYDTRTNSTTSRGAGSCLSV